MRTQTVNVAGMMLVMSWLSGCATVESVVSAPDVSLRNVHVQRPPKQTLSNHGTSRSLVRRT